MNKIFIALAFSIAFWPCGCTTNNISYQLPAPVLLTTEEASLAKKARISNEVTIWKVYARFGNDWEPIAKTRDYRVQVNYLPNGIVIVDNGYDCSDQRYRLLFYNDNGSNRKLPIKVISYDAFGIFKKETTYGN